MQVFIQGYSVHKCFRNIMYINNPSYESREDEKVNRKHHQFTKIMNAKAFIVVVIVGLLLFLPTLMLAAPSLQPWHL